MTEKTLKEWAKKGVTLKLAAILVPLTTLFVATLVLGFYTIFTLKGDAKNINYAGQIRYRSYLLALKVNEYPILPGGARDSAHRAILLDMEDFETILYGLRDGNKALGLKGFKPPPGTKEGVFSFTDPWWQFDRHIKDYNERVKPLILHTLNFTSQAEAMEALKLYNKNVHNLVTDVDRTVHLLQSLSEEKLSSFKTTEFTLLGLFLGIIGTSFFLAVFFIRRPLLDIIKGAKAFSRGALNYRIPVRGRDEIGALAQGFNTMAETIENDIKEMQQLHSQRMSTVGHLSNGVAHHINNPLSGIDMSADILLKKIEGSKEHIHPEELRNHLRRIKEAGRRCETVVKDLLSISRISNPEKSPKVLNRLIELTLNKTANQLEPLDVQLIKELSPTAPMVLCNHAQLEVAFVNLISNTIDVLPKGGTLTVKTHHLTSEDKVEVTISDTGPTIDKKDLPHLFDPYFILRIRPSTRCTGLELALAQLAILSHGGTIEVESEEGKGTTFRVKLPVYNETAELPAEKDAGKGRLVRMSGYHVARASCWKRGRRRGRSFRALP